MTVFAPSSLTDAIPSNPIAIVLGLLPRLDAELDLSSEPQREVFYRCFQRLNQDPAALFVMSQLELEDRVALFDFVARVHRAACDFISQETQTLNDPAVLANYRQAGAANDFLERLDHYRALLREATDLSGHLVRL